MSVVKQISATARTQVGKGAARAVRREGKVPAVIYGAGKPPTPISLDRKQTQLLVYKDLSKVDVVFKFAVYSYDPIEKKYFKCMLGTEDAELNGLLEKNGADLNLSVADEASGEVQSPENYAFQIGVKPQPSAQVVTVATSFSDKVVKSWGMKVEK